VKDQPIPTPHPSPYRWVKLSLHCRLTDDTPDAVHARRKKRVWIDGVQCKVAEDGNLYINPEEWNKWVEGNREQSSARAA
jgi:hypothetical protein